MRICAPRADAPDYAAVRWLYLCPCAVAGEFSLGQIHIRAVAADRGVCRTNLRGIISDIANCIVQGTRSNECIHTAVVGPVQKPTFVAAALLDIVRFKPETFTSNLDDESVGSLEGTAFHRPKVRALFSTRICIRIFLVRLSS